MGFRKLGMEVSQSNAKGIFHLLDIDDKGSIDLEKFALGIQQFHGFAKSLDIARIRLDNKRLARQITHLANTMVDLFKRLGVEKTSWREPSDQGQLVQVTSSHMIMDLPTMVSVASTSTYDSQPTAPHDRPVSPPRIEHPSPPRLSGAPVLEKT